MKLIFRTQVDQPPEQVWQRFDRELFLKLAPPFPRIRLLRFDGCMTGDIVEIELNMIFFRQTWTSVIADQSARHSEIYFVDKGQDLPFFLHYWKHRHRLIRSGDGTEIIDQIEYRSPTLILDWLLYPAMWLQFAYRKPIYRREFAQSKKIPSPPPSAD